MTSDRLRSSAAAPERALRGPAGGAIRGRATALTDTPTIAAPTDPPTPMTALTGPVARTATARTATARTATARSIRARTAQPARPAQDDIPRFEFSPHNCFACGTLNAHGLGLVLHVEHGSSWTELTLEPTFEGWAGIAHGGIICTILDEVMAWALVGADNWGVTARMSVAFRRPVPVGRPIRAEGSIAKVRRRIVETTARLVDAETGELLATATGTYVAADQARKRELRERYGYRLLPGTRSDGATADQADAGASAGTETAAGMQTATGRGTATGTDPAAQGVTLTGARSR